MSYSELLGFVVATFALIASPGPTTIALAGSGAAYSFQKSRKFLLGTITSAAFVSIIVGAGLLSLLLSSQYGATILLIISSVVMLYVAYKIGTAPPPKIGLANKSPPGFITGLLINLANPKAYASFAAPLAAYELLSDAPILSTAVELIIALSLLAVTNTLWLVLGNQLTNVFQKPMVGRCINIVFAVLMLTALLGVLLWSSSVLIEPKNGF